MRANMRLLSFIRIGGGVLTTSVHDDDLEQLIHGSPLCRDSPALSLCADPIPAHSEQDTYGNMKEEHQHRRFKFKY